MRINIQNKQLFSKVIKSMFPDLELPKINGLTIDSRNIKAGDIFLPLKGAEFDGHQFISQAAKSHASLAFVENNIGYPMLTQKVVSTKHFLYDLARKYRENLSYPLIGITGSNGKTTTKDLLHHVLSKNYLFQNLDFQ